MGFTRYCNRTIIIIITNTVITTMVGDYNNIMKEAFLFKF